MSKNLIFLLFPKFSSLQTSGYRGKVLHYVRILQIEPLGSIVEVSVDLVIMIAHPRRKPGISPEMLYLTAGIGLVFLQGANKLPDVRMHGFDGIVDLMVPALHAVVSPGKVSTDTSTSLLPTEPAGAPGDPRILYGTNITQLLLGLLISLENSLVLAAIFTRHHLKTSTNVLLGNICFANVVCGIMLCVVNVMDGWTQVALLKTETSLAIINCFITIATLLALITNKYVAIKSPDFKMSTGSCGRIVLIMWVVTLTLMLLKAMVYAFSEMGYTHACFRCYQVFEVVTLVIFTLSTVVGYGVTAYRAATHRKRTVHDGSRPMQADYSVEYRAVAGIGGLLLVFAICFVFFVSMYMTWLGSGTILKGADEILITLFFLHCIINPFIICSSNRDLGANVKRIGCCGRGRRPDTPRGLDQHHIGGLGGGRFGNGGLDMETRGTANGATTVGFQRTNSGERRFPQGAGYQQPQQGNGHPTRGGDGGEMISYFHPPPPPANPNSVPHNDYNGGGSINSGGNNNNNNNNYSSNHNDQQPQSGFTTGRPPYVGNNDYNGPGGGGSDPIAATVRPLTAVSLPPIDRGGRAALIQSQPHHDTPQTDYGSTQINNNNNDGGPPHYSELNNNHV